MNISNIDAEFKYPQGSVIIESSDESIESIKFVDCVFSESKKASGVDLGSYKDDEGEFVNNMSVAKA